MWYIEAIGFGKILYYKRDFDMLDAKFIDGWTAFSSDKHMFKDEAAAQSKFKELEPPDDVFHFNLIRLIRDPVETKYFPEKDKRNATN